MINSEKWTKVIVAEGPVDSQTPAAIKLDLTLNEDVKINDFTYATYGDDSNSLAKKSKNIRRRQNPKKNNTDQVGIVDISTNLDNTSTFGDCPEDQAITDADELSGKLSDVINYSNSEDDGDLAMMYKDNNNEKEENKQKTTFWKKTFQFFIYLLCYACACAGICVCATRRLR